MKLLVADSCHINPPPHDTILHRLRHVSWGLLTSKGSATRNFTDRHVQGLSVISLEEKSRTLYPVLFPQIIVTENMVQLTTSLQLTTHYDFLYVVRTSTHYDFCTLSVHQPIMTSVRFPSKTLRACADQTPPAWQVQKSKRILSFV